MPTSSSQERGYSTRRDADPTPGRQDGKPSEVLVDQQAGDSLGPPSVGPVRAGEDPGRVEQGLQECSVLLIQVFHQPFESRVLLRLGRPGLRTDLAPGLDRPLLAMGDL